MLLSKWIGGYIIKYKKIFCLGFIFSFLFVLISFHILKVNNIQVDKIEVANSVKDKVHISHYDNKDINSLRLEYNNSDIIGYISIPNVISTPVVKNKDNEYYMYKNLYKKTDKLGSPFMDYRVNKDDRKMIIYGHNSSKYNAPFSNLEKYYNEDFYENNKYIYLNYENEVIKYEIFSVFIETSDWFYTKINFKNDIEWFNHINNLKDKSWYKTDVLLNESDKILILQTCSNLDSYKEYENKYLLIVAKKMNN